MSDPSNEPKTPMSQPPASSGPPTPTPPPDRLGGCAQVLAILVGLVLLLPGICGIFLAGLDPHELMVDPSMLLLVLGLIAVGVGGVALIWWAVRRR
jgi:hypothetical protein